MSDTTYLKRNLKSLLSRRGMSLRRRRARGGAESRACRAGFPQGGQALARPRPREGLEGYPCCRGQRGLFPAPDALDWQIVEKSIRLARLHTDN
jgi:hypothetical protein